MTHKSYKEESRKDWGIDGDDKTRLDRDQVKLGALLRIADATEAMAKRHAELIEDRDRFERYFRLEQSRRMELERSAAALKGQITKLKKRLAKAQTQAFAGDPAATALHQSGEEETHL